MEKAIKKYWPFFLLPTLAAFIIGFVWPFLWGIFLSFQNPLEVPGISLSSFLRNATRELTGQPVKLLAFQKKLNPSITSASCSPSTAPCGKSCISSAKPLRLGRPVNSSCVA